ncbi:MAG: hypothetical protein HY735_11885 [Verrucomicrobia bacterium]|nr:hypothetical protein [Verrucomicrobiota bacterium]
MQLNSGWHSADFSLLTQTSRPYPVAWSSIEYSLPISCRIDHARRRLYTRAEGVVTYAEMRAHVYTDLSSEEAAYGEIIDCSNATTNVTGADMRQLAAERKKVDERQRRPGPVAVVATDDLFYGMLRMYDVLTERIRPFRVFREMREAECWLDSLT